MSRQPGQPRKVGVLERRQRLKKMARLLVGRSRAERERVLNGAREVFLDPRVCDDCWAIPCTCLPFPCPCGGSIEVLGGPGDDTPQHSEPACAPYIADPTAYSRKIIDPYLRALLEKTS